MPAVCDCRKIQVFSLLRVTFLFVPRLPDHTLAVALSFPLVLVLPSSNFSSTMAKTRSYRGLVTFIILAAAGAAAWYYFRAKENTAPVYTTAALALGNIQQVITATGTLQPVTSIEIGSQVSGLVTEVLVDFNSLVKANQLIAKIDPATYEQRLRQAQADMASTKASFTLTELNTKRTRSLREGNLVSQQELDQAEAQLSQAEAQLLTKQAAVENAKVDLDRCSIFSPVDGIVLDRQVEVGKTVAASLNAPVLFIIADDLAKMQIAASIAEADIGSVADGQNVNFTVDAYPNRQFRGRVSQIRNSPKTESNVVTYQTIIDVRNADLKLKPGMTANVSVIIAQRENTVRLPNSALRVRMPEGLATPDTTVASAPAQAGPSGSASAPPAAPAGREQMMALMRDAGFTPGSGPPSEAVRTRMRELAKERGIEIPANFGPGGGNRERSAESGAPVTRTVYKLGGTPEAPRPIAVSVQLGITDGSQTEVVSGLKEGDLIITSVTVANATTTAGSAAASNPFSPQRPGPRR